MKNSSVVAIFKFFIFFILFCLALGISREFLLETQSNNVFSLTVFLSSVFFSFFFYVFIADLNDLYKKVQMFFFHSASLSYFVPFLLVIAGVVYFVFPKLFNVTLSKDLFLFIGTFVFTSHMIYIAAETKGDNFAAFISYLLNLDIFYICNLILLGIYFKIIYRFEVLKVVINGLRDGLFILRSTFVQIF